MYQISIMKNFLNKCPVFRVCLSPAVFVFYGFLAWIKRIDLLIDWLIDLDATFYRMRHFQWLHKYVSKT